MIFNHIKNGDAMEDIMRVVIRALVSFITLFLVTKLIGKKQVSELSIFDYVIGISIGNFAAELTLNLDTKIIHAVLAVTLFGFISYLISILAMKSIVFRRFFVGVPTIIIQDGVLLEKSLKKVKMDVNDLLEECRLNGYFDISAPEYVPFFLVKTIFALLHFDLPSAILYSTIFPYLFFIDFK